MQDAHFIEELSMLKGILDKTSMQIAIKWGAEVYTHNGKNIVSYGGFKHHFCLWFYNGVFLKDPYRVLVNANEDKTKALRQWRFTAKDQIDEEKILEYLLEAVENEENGLSWKPEKTTMPELPKLMLDAFDSDNAIRLAFDNLSPYKQKEYIEHITSAKQEKTQVARLQKSIPMIMSGIGLNDKYKKG